MQEAVAMPHTKRDHIFAALLEINTTEVKITLEKLQEQNFGQISLCGYTVAVSGRPSHATVMIVCG